MSIFSQYKSGSSNDENHLRLSPAILGSFPYTVAAWFRSMDPAKTNSTIVQIAGAGNTSNCNRLHVDAGVVSLRVGISTYTAFSTGVVRSSSWQHACGVRASATMRAAYLNGGNKGTNVVSFASTSSADACLLGANNTGGGFAGNVALLTVWNVALSDYQISILARGIDPTCILPRSIVYHDTQFAGRGEVARKPRISRNLFSVTKPYAGNLFNNEPREPSPAPVHSRYAPFVSQSWMSFVRSDGSFFPFFNSH